MSSGYKRALRTQGGGTDESFRAQSNVESYLNPLGRAEILNGVLVEDVVLGATPVAINHRLGRKFRGFILVKSNANVSIYQPSESPFPELTANLAASSTCTVSIWFF
jgi:hypothetical protein